MERELQLRRAMNAKRPKFAVSNKHKRKRVSRCSWRAPRGLHNKLKLHRYGKRSVVKVGYRNPRLVRGLSKSGLRPVRINNLNELLAINPKTQGALIARVGMKKRLELLRVCKDKGIVVVDVKVDDVVAKIERDIKARKESKRAVKAESKEEKPKKVEKKEEVLDADEKKEKERKEMEKVLTRKEQ